MIFIVSGIDLRSENIETSSISPDMKDSDTSSNTEHDIK